MDKRKEFGRRAAWLCGTALSFGQVFAPAIAQEDQSLTIEEVVVTGSHIRMPDFASPNPVITISSQAIEASGKTNLTDYLVKNPALVGSSTNYDTGGLSSGESGLNVLNLRNLGENRTLTLVDGRRHVSGRPGSAAVDVNTIPTDLVERVEILTGGASAIYGADGVSGVVNLIMKKNFEGISVHAQGGLSNYGDAGSRLFSVTAGKNFADGRGNIAVTFDRQEDDRLDFHDRKSLRYPNRIAFHRNPNDPDDDPNLPDEVPIAGVAYSDSSHLGAIDVDYDGYPDFYGNGQPWDPGIEVPPYYQIGGSGVPEAEYYGDVQPRVRRNTANLLFHFDLAPAATFFAEGKWSKSHNKSFSQPSFDYYLWIEPDNPYIPANVADAVAASDDQILEITRDNFDLGFDGEDVSRTTKRGVIGLKGDFSEHLRYEVSYNYGETTLVNKHINNQFTDRFYAALDAVRDPDSGEIVCRATLDPNWVVNQPEAFERVWEDGTGPQSFMAGANSGCVPFNPFGNGVASQASIDWIHANTIDRAKATQQVASALISGDTGSFLELPGGPIGFAVGSEWRKEKSVYTPDPAVAGGLTWHSIYQETKGQIEVKEAFGEVNLPILKDRDFFKTLSVGGAVRFSDYKKIGNTTTWKVDAVWAPISDISFRGTLSQAVRVPNIGELYSPPGQSYEGIDDPCDAAYVNDGTQYREANCRALLTGLGVADPANFTDPNSAAVGGLQSGNINLKPEKARTKTLGVVLQPSFIRSLRLAFDWYDIKLTDAVNQVDGEQLVELCVDQPTLQNVFCDAVTRQAGSGRITSFIVRPENVANFRTSGVDMNLSYSWTPEADLGKFDFRLTGSYLDRLEFIDTPGADVRDDRNQRYKPKWLANGSLTWSRDPLTVTWGVSWQSKTLRYTPDELAGDPDITYPQYIYYRAKWEHDLNISWDVSDSINVYVGANNVFNAKPDIGAASYPVSVIGRFFYFGATAKFGGF